MRRVTLTELVVQVRRESDASDLHDVEWRLQSQPGDPDPEATSQLLLAYRSVFRLAADEIERLGDAAIAALLAGRVFTPVVDDLIARCARAARARHGWGRVVMELPREGNDGRDGDHGRQSVDLAALPWEALFGFRGVTVIRRDPAPPVQRAMPALPLKLCMLADGDSMRLDLHLRTLIDSGAVVLHGQLATADIVHVAASSSDSSLLEETVHRMRAHVHSVRLVVVHARRIDRSSAALGSRLQDATGADAVLCVAGPNWRLRQLYRDLARDWPLDRCLRATRSSRESSPWHAAILRCRDGGETVVSLSRILDAALRASQAAFTEKSWTDVIGADAASTIDHGTTLHGEWWAALQHPASQLAARARALALDGRARDVRTMVELVEEAHLLGGEVRAVEGALWQVAMSPAAQIAAASARVTEIRIIDPLTGRELPVGEPVIANRSYQLEVQIVRAAGAAAWVAAQFPEDALRHTFARLDAVELSILVYAPGERIRIDRTRDALRLPRLGDSNAARFGLVVLQPGRFAVRVCAFYGTALLQATVLEGHAGDIGLETQRRVTLDYAASATFMQLDRVAQPAMTIWTNAINGTHWFGVYSADRHAAANGLLVELSADDLAGIAHGLASALQGVALTNPADLAALRSYRFVPPGAPDARQRADRRQQLAHLAWAGACAYATLFAGVQVELAPTSTDNAALLMIARCRPDHRNLAWSALYDLPLDTSEPTVCAVFDEQVVAGNDLLDSPARCRAQPRCPLSDPARAQRTVCPFGFWGIRYRIEQPLHHVAIRPPAPAAAGLTVCPPTDAASVSIAYDDLERAAAARARVGADDRTTRGPRIGIAFWPFFDARALRHLHDVPAVRRESDRDQVLEMLRDEPADIYYFFCHGEGHALGFQLRVGPRPQGDVITVATLRGVRWPSTGTAPLVFLNGCNTTAFTSEKINKLAEQLRVMGASGVIGTEISVHTYLAEDVGRRVLSAMIGGASLGDAFLQMRRGLLREQYNPLGFAYSFFASAELRL